MSPVALILVIVVIVGVVAWLITRQRKGVSPGSQTGSNIPTCKKQGDACGVTDCCEGSLTCLSGHCVASGMLSATPAFFLSIYGKCIGETALGNLGETAQSCAWDPSIIPSSFWEWDGVGQLILKTPVLDVNNKIVDKITNKYLQPPSGADTYVSVGDGPTTGIVLNQEGTIYSKDFSLCVNVDGQGNLIWQRCQGYPLTFDVIQPSGCSTGKCSSDTDCCPPYGSCVDGNCATCLGKPGDYTAQNCPTIANYAVCTPDGTYKCKSQCDGTTITCDPDHVAVCERDDVTGQFSLRCEYRCTGSLSCVDGIAVCTGDATGGWDWQCPYIPCDHPDSFPTSDQAPSPGAGYTWVTDHWEDGSAGPWMYPKWQCGPSSASTGSWTYVSGCNQNYYMTGCSSTQKAVCSIDTSFQWVCADNRTYLDMCGLSSTTGDCGVDAVCVDIGGCGLTTVGSDNWRWLCPSSEGLTRCEMLKIAGWHDSEIGSGLAMNVANSPVYPTVKNSLCRDPSATDQSFPDFEPVVGNPSAILLGNGTNDSPYSLIPTPGSFDGVSQYIFTNHYSSGTIANWLCASDNPCYPNGSFINADATGSPYSSPATLNRNGVLTPPDSSELFTIGKCSCNPGYAGITCTVTGGVCNNVGIVHQCDTLQESSKCNTVEQYWCECDSSHFGNSCQFTAAQCSNHGTPVDNSDTLQCQCSGLFSGSTCATCVSTTPVRIDPTQAQLVYMVPLNIQGNIIMVADDVLGYQYGGVWPPGPNTNVAVQTGASCLLANDAMGLANIYPYGDMGYDNAFMIAPGAGGSFQLLIGTLDSTWNGTDLPDSPAPYSVSPTTPNVRALSWHPQAGIEDPNGSFGGSSSDYIINECGFLASSDGAYMFKLIKYSDGFNTSPNMSGWAIQSVPVSQISGSMDGFIYLTTVPAGTPTVWNQMTINNCPGVYPPLP